MELDKLRTIIAEVLCVDETVVMQIIADQLHISADSLREETSFADIGADSLDVFQIVMGIEEEFGIEIAPADAEKISTVGEAVELIRNTR